MISQKIILERELKISAIVLLAVEAMYRRLYSCLTLCPSSMSYVLAGK
jgi:hypothetical protein